MYVKRAVPLTKRYLVSLSRLPLSCHVRQLVVWAISADRAAGVHGSRADYSPPVAHFPSPLNVPVFYS